MKFYFTYLLNGQIELRITEWVEQNNKAYLLHTVKTGLLKEIFKHIIAFMYNETVTFDEATIIEKK